MLNKKNIISAILIVLLSMLIGIILSKTVFKHRLTTEEKQEAKLEKQERSENRKIEQTFDTQLTINNIKITDGQGNLLTTDIEDQWKDNGDNTKSLGTLTLSNDQIPRYYFELLSPKEIKSLDQTTKTKILNILYNGETKNYLQLQATLQNQTNDQKFKIQVANELGVSLVDLEK